MQGLDSCLALLHVGWRAGDVPALSPLLTPKAEALPLTHVEKPGGGTILATERGKEVPPMRPFRPAFFVCVFAALAALGQAGCCHWWHHRHCCYPPDAARLSPR